MDLGAVVCRPVPACADCPLAESCVWSAAGHPSPDPSVGSAGVSKRQAPFEGSDRQRRGRVLAALGDGKRPASEFDHSIVAGLLDDELVTLDGDDLSLPS